MTRDLKNNKWLQWFNFGLLIMFCTLVLFGESSYAQSKQYSRKKSVKKSVKSKTKKKTSDKLDITGLEKKYWAPKDTDFTVVQNRTYTKKNKYVVSLMYGVPINDPYNQGYALSLTGNYFFSERSGVQVSYQEYDLRDGELIDAFLGAPGNTTSLKPDYGRIKSQIQVGYTYVPVYAKVSVLGKKIVYLDMAITPHIGTVSYDQLFRVGVTPNFRTETSSQSSISYGVDITQYIFIGRHIALRADLKNTFFKEEILDYVTGNPKRSRTTNATLFTFGVSFYF